MDELSEIFSIERVNKSGARFDPEKARWFNHQYLMLKDDESLAQLFGQDLSQRGVASSPALNCKVVALVKERVNFVSEMWQQASFFYQAPESYDEKVAQKRWKDGIPVFMALLADNLVEHGNWHAEAIKAFVSARIEAEGVNFGAVLNSFRLALVGGSFGPDLFVIAELLGKEETIARIRKAVERL